MIQAVLDHSGVPIPHQLSQLQFNPGHFVAEAFKTSLCGKIDSAGVLLRLQALQKRRSLHSEESEPRLEHLDFQSSNESVHDESFKTHTCAPIL